MKNPQVKTKIRQILVKKPAISHPIASFSQEWQPTLDPTFTDGDALVQIKEPSRKLYAIAFNQLREYLGKDLEIEPPSEKELLDYFKYLR